MSVHRILKASLVGLVMVSNLWVASNSVDASPPSGSTQNGLVAYWSFDSSTAFAAPDSGGSTLTNNNGASWSASGKFGGALSLNGSNQSLSDLSSPSYLPVGNAPYSQSLWFKPTVIQVRGMIAWGVQSTGRFNALRLLGTSGGLHHYWWAKDVSCAAAQCAISAGNWYHAVTTWDGTTRKIYFNGELKASDRPTALNTTAQNFHIGRTIASEYFIGLLDDVALYNRALTASEVGEMASATTTTTTTTTTLPPTTTTTTTTLPPTTTTTLPPTTTTTLPPTTTTTTTTVAPVLEIIVDVPVSTLAPSNQAPPPTTTTTTTVARENTDVMTLTPSTVPVVTSKGATTTTTAATTATTTTSVPPRVVVKVPNIQSVSTGQVGIKVGDNIETATTSRIDNQLVVSAGPLKATVASLNDKGKVSALDDDGNVRLKPGDGVRITLAGFEPDSIAEAWLFSAPVLMGTEKVKSDGTISGLFKIPKNTPNGAHRIAIVARTNNGKPATLTIGINVGDPQTGPNVAVWLIALPIASAVIAALAVPATRRRRRAAKTA